MTETIATTTPGNWGGTRPGAGKPRRRVAFYLDADTRRALERIAAANDLKPEEFARNATLVALAERGAIPDGGEE